MTTTRMAAARPADAAVVLGIRSGDIRMWPVDSKRALDGPNELAGTVRTLNSETRQRIHRRIAEVAEGTAAALGGEAEVEIFDGYPVLENDPVATDFVERTVAGAGAGISFQSMDPVMGGEDFAFYAQRIPAAFYALGVCPAGVDQYPHLHQPNYDFSDGAIPHGVRMHVEVARRFWDNWPRS